MVSEFCMSGWHPPCHMSCWREVSSNDEKTNHSILALLSPHSRANSFVVLMFPFLYIFTWPSTKPTPESPMSYSFFCLHVIFVNQNRLHSIIFATKSSSMPHSCQIYLLFAFLYIFSSVIISIALNIFPFLVYI